MKLAHGLVQIARQLRHGLRAHYFSRQQAHHPPHLPRRDPAQKRFADEQAHLVGPALELRDHLGQEPALAAARNPQTQRPEAGDKIPQVISVAMILARRRPAIARTHHVPVALPLAQQLEKLLGRPLRLALQVAPKTFLQLLHKMLEMLGDRDYLRHGV